MKTPLQSVDMSRTLLVVDDEQLMTEIISQIMNRRGFRVLTASSGKEALKIIEQERASLSLIITDLMMPLMNGVELAEEIYLRWPDLPILLASGYDHLEDPMPPNIVQIVIKPFRNRQLAEYIEQALQITCPFNCSNPLP